MQMSMTEFWIVLGVCTVTMVLCRTVPLFVLKGKSLPPAFERALGYLPPAAFAALVANDLLSPDMFAQGLWPAAAPLLAALVVVLVAVKSKSLLLCAVTGVVAYALLLLI